MSSEESELSTRISLLDVLADGQADSRAWGIFVDRYGRLLYRWCRRWGSSESDAQDVIQETLMTVVRKISHFRHQQGGSFRGWLKTIAHRCWIKVVEKADRHSPELRTDSGAAFRALASATARDDLVRSFDEWARQEMLSLAMARVRRRVDPNTWEAFRLSSIERKSAVEVSQLLQMSAGAIYMATCRVRKMLKEEINRIDPSD